MTEDEVILLSKRIAEVRRKSKSDLDKAILALTAEASAVEKQASNMISQGLAQLPVEVKDEIDG